MNKKNQTQEESTWKFFDQNPLTHSAAHYLMTIAELVEGQGYARITDVAKELNITKGSCSISVKALKNRGLVNEDDNRFLRLSNEGEELVSVIQQNAELLQIFFRDILQVDKWQAEVDACKVEHLISIETSMQLSRFVQAWQNDTDLALRIKKVTKN